MKKSGFKACKNIMERITPEIEAKFDTANRENAEEIVDLAKVLIPSGPDDSRSKIRNIPGDDHSQLIDFGPKSKVIEGNRGPRPFVNPALKATKKSRDARSRKAIKSAVRAVMGHGS